MKEVMSNAASGVSTEFPAAIYYAFKASDFSSDGLFSPGWATFIQTLLDAGFSLHGTWPIRSEYTGNLKKNVNALANSVVLVCCKKVATAEVLTRAEFTRALKRELPGAITELQAANIAPADMPQSAIGPGMGVFSRYSAVLVH
jgi:putative DNA methylase